MKTKRRLLSPTSSAVSDLTLFVSDEGDISVVGVAVDLSFSGVLVVSGDRLPSSKLGAAVGVLVGKSSLSKGVKLTKRRHSVSYCE